MEKIRKRDGRIVPFEENKITEAIFKAVRSVGGTDFQIAQRLTKEVTALLDQKYKHRFPNVEEVQDAVEKTLIENGHALTAKAYILYRQSHAEIREVRKLFDSIEVIEDYISQNDWRVKENSNMNFSLQGLNNYISARIIASYWLSRVYLQNIKKAHENGDIHIHDLCTLGPYCVGWDLRDLLLEGFKGVLGKIECKPAKHFRVALQQTVNFFYTMQGESAGAQAFSNFDTYLAPFIRYDELNYEQVKQSMQEFLFNMNVPTRVGFQCMSEDTEILTPEGWARYDEVKKGSKIKTFNIKTGKIENQTVRTVFKKQYKGVMYNLKNRIQDQLISPKHRVVRKKFQSNEYILEPIEDVLKLKSPFIVPIAGKNTNKEAKISDEKLKLLTWIISEGTIERPTKYRCCYRVSIYQSKMKNKKHYAEIISLLKHFKLNYSESESASLGNKVVRIRLNAESSRKIHEWFGTKENIHFIPKIMMEMSERQSKLFLSTYLKADGFENCKIATTDPDILDGLQVIAVNAGYGFTVLKRKPTIGKKDIFVLRLIKHKESYIQKVEKVKYNGIIWCPNTKNETVIARRNGKVFITGNTPFTNITMDIKIPSFMKEEKVIIGGKLKEDKYGDFQKEMDMFNKAFAEVMLEGDAKGRVFTFPIPTYNITKDFDWDNPDYDAIWEMTAKYGIPYFSNFINSDLKPDDVRSMCCRLRIDNRELKHRGGGLFGSNPLTGSIGVATINMARVGYLAKTEEEYFKILEQNMQLCKESLITKRKMLEVFTNKGLYPYSYFYLRDVKKAHKEWWKNHFSTIGINGLNESMVNFLGKNIGDKEGNEFAVKVMNFMRDKLADYQEETGQIFNLEATPGEGCTYRFAKKDKELYPDIIVANEESLKEGKTKHPYYTNSSHLPVNYTDDIFEALTLQDNLQSLYTGGTVLHGFIGERMPSKEATKDLVRKIANKFKLPYFTISPTFSVCPKHGYIQGEQEFCPICDEEINYAEVEEE